MVRIEEAFKAAADFRHEEPPWARAPPQPPPNLPEITQQAIDVYMLSQGPRGGIRGIGWWQFANGFTAIALHDSWSGTKRNYERLADALRKCEGQHTGFINEYNDDTLWYVIIGKGTSEGEELRSFRVLSNAGHRIMPGRQYTLSLSQIP